MLPRIISSLRSVTRIGNISKFHSDFRLLSSFAISEADYEKKADRLLENLSEYLDTFPEWLNCDDDFDVNYAMGVLTANVSRKIGTYVINKQTPNRQIWLSSPVSGPKRYDLIGEKWVYSHDGVSLDSLLNSEFRKIFGSNEIDFSKRCT